MHMEELLDVAADALGPVQKLSILLPASCVIRWRVSSVSASGGPCNAYIVSMRVCPGTVHIEALFEPVACVMGRGAAAHHPAISLCV